MVSVRAIVIWTLLLMGLGILALLTSRSVERDLGVQVERQSSLLATLSDLGEGLVITEKGRFIAGNDAYVTLTGYSREELAAMPSLIDLAPADDRDRLAANLARRLGGGAAPARYTSALISKSGRRVDVEVAIHRVTSRRDQLLTLVTDVSEKLRAEAAEHERESPFRTLFEQAQRGMAFASLDGHVTTVNPAFCELVGYSETELRTLSLVDITHPDDVAALQDAMHSMLAGEEEGRRIEKRYTRKDGEHVWVDLTMRLVRGADSRPLYFQTVAVDIRDRKRAEVLQAARFAVTQALVTSPGWDNAAPGVLEGLCRTLDWELAEYWEVDAPREAMHFVTSWKRPGRDTTAFEATAANQTYRRGEGLAGRVWEAGGPIAMPDLAGDPTPRSAAAVASGLHGIVGFPVRSGRRVVGMISLHTWAARGLDDGLVVVSSMQVGARHLFIATLRDISERKAHTDALEYQALHDALTGLPNRSLFGDRLRQALLAARRNQKMFGVLLLDLDRFKDINDALGRWLRRLSTGAGGADAAPLGPGGRAEALDSAGRARPPLPAAGHACHGHDPFGGSARPVEPPTRGLDAARPLHPHGRGDGHHPSPDRVGDRRGADPAVQVDRRRH